MNNFHRLLQSIHESLTPDQQELADITAKHGFGSINWQNAMIDRIKRKLQNKEPLTGADVAFIEIQAQHNRTIEIQELEKMWKAEYKGDK